VVAVSLVLAACSNSPDASAPSIEPTPTETPSSPVGRIVFKRLVPGQDGTSIFTVNPDGSDVRQILPGPAEFARWAPDGTEISVLCCDDGMSAHFIDVDSGEVRTLAPPDPTLETYCGAAWSPDGERLLCETFGVDDPSLNGRTRSRLDSS